MKKIFCFKKAAFTLAELLITLSVIGVVAALTLPTLFNAISEIIKNHQIAVFERKLSKGTDLLNIDYGIGPYYSGDHPTLDFVKRLSEHMKIVTICDKDHLDNCFHYEEIQIKDNDPIKVTKLEDGDNFGLNSNDYKDVAGFVLADGTAMILSWNTNCPVSDPDAIEYSSVSADKYKKSSSDTTSCIKGIYDLNGNSKPNLFLKDVMPYGGVALKGSGVKIAGIKIAKILTYEDDYQALNRDSFCYNDYSVGWWKTDVNALGRSLGIKGCDSDSSQKWDRWAGAIQACGGVKYVPTVEQMVKLMKTTYSNPDSIKSSGYSGSYVVYQNNTDFDKLLKGYGITSPRYFWTSEENGAYAKYARLSNTNPLIDSAYRITSYFGADDSDKPSVICLENPND